MPLNKNANIRYQTTDSPNPRKYWSALKSLLCNTGNELTADCSQQISRVAYRQRHAFSHIASGHINSLVRTIPLTMQIPPSLSVKP